MKRIYFASPVLLFACGFGICLSHAAVASANSWPTLLGKYPAQEMPSMNGGQQPNEQKQMPHMNDKPKHGGIFFMAQDGAHHVEGLLLPSKMFRLYVYDVYDEPLVLDKLKQAKATLQVGPSMTGAADIPLMLSKDEKTMEATLGKDLEPPVVVTLSIHFPDSPPDKTEKFTFRFKDYSERKAAAPMNDSGDEMRMDH